MARFPKISNPCPYMDRLASVMDGDTCRACKRQVHDLSAMGEAKRDAFLKACSGREVCVSYRIRPALVGAALAAAAVTAPVAASAQLETIIVVAGGLRVDTHTAYVETNADRATPVLPVIYENTGDAPKTASKAKDLSQKRS